jgi:hypothetical protein
MPYRSGAGQTDRYSVAGTDNNGSLSCWAEYDADRTPEAFW